MESENKANKNNNNNENNKDNNNQEKFEFQPYDLKTNKNLSEIILNSNYDIIDFNANNCLITLLGTSSENIKFILRIKKKEFQILNEEKTSEKYKELLDNLVQEIQLTSNIVFNNDIYFKIISQSNDNNLKIDFIFPADKKVIEKYSKKFYILFEENYDIYLKKTLKYIEGIDPKHTKWIHNALYENTERILFSIPNEFIILQDFNSYDNLKVLNCLGICYEKIKTLRDLNSSHLDLLSKFYNEGVNKLTI